MVSYYGPEVLLAYLDAVIPFKCFELGWRGVDTVVLPKPTSVPPLIVDNYLWHWLITKKSNWPTLCR